MRRVRITRHATVLAALLATMALAAAPAWGAPGAAGPAVKADKPGQAKPRPQSKPNGLGAGVIGTGTGTGIVQSVMPRGVVVRALDGSIVRVPVSPRTRVLVNGRRATLADVKPGFVVRFAGPAGRAARVLRAFDPGRERKTGAATVAAVSSTPAS